MVNSPWNLESDPLHLPAAYFSVLRDLLSAFVQDLQLWSCGETSGGCSLRPPRTVLLKQQPSCPLACFSMDLIAAYHATHHMLSISHDWDGDPHEQGLARPVLEQRWHARHAQQTLFE